MDMNPNIFPWMDVYNTTRYDYTNGLGSVPLPANSAPGWLNLVTKLRVLHKKLAEHPAMAPNLQQTFMTPAANKNNVYFVWDFVGRTLGMCYNIDPELKHHRKGEPLPEDYMDVLGRSFMASQLILDTKPGTLDMMTETTYPEQRGQHPQFGEEILQLARELMESDEEE